MIVPLHLEHYDRLRMLDAFRSPMLMLGRQESRLGDPRVLFGVAEYLTLDPDGGDLPLDLAGDLTGYEGEFASVINLGVIEHVWDAHSAWSNALRLVKVGGMFATVSPVGGWENHGIHVTDERFIREFISINGFSVVRYWLTLQNGSPIASVQRKSGNQLLWLVAVKRYTATRFAKPQQVFRNGRKETWR